MRSILHPYRQGSAGTKGGHPGGLDRGKLGGIAALLTRRTRRLLGRPLTLGLTLLVAVALIGVWVRVVRTLLEPVEHTPPIGQPSAVVWGDRVFTSSAQLRSFLDARGLSYSRWARAHPYAFTGRTPPAAVSSKVAAAAGRKVPAKASTRAAPQRRAAPQTGGGAGSGSKSLSAALVWVLLVSAAVVLGLLATVAAPLVPRIAGGLYLDPERRASVFAASLAILVGLLIAYYLI